MEVQLTVPKGTDIRIIAKEYFDLYEDEDYEEEQVFFIGKSSDDPDEEIGEWLTYDEAVEFCGFCDGVLSQVEGAWTLIEGNGDWAQGMISRKDFSSFDLSDIEKAEYKRVSNLYWKAYRRGKRKHGRLAQLVRAADS